MERISPKLFYQYLTCPHWVWFDRFGDLSKKGEVNELQQKLLEQGVIHETEFMREYFAQHEVVEIDSKLDADTALARTRDAMKAGAAVIYHGRLRTTHYEGVPDLLVRCDGASKFGEWWYEPIDIKSAGELKEEHKHQLTLYALALADMQGTEPPRAGIYTPSGELLEFDIESFREKFFTVLELIEAAMSGERPPLQLTKACMNSPWFDECVRQAQDSDDMALLYKVDKRALTALREFGVHTVEDARHIDPSAFGDRIPYLKQNGLERMKAQAESLKTNQIFLRRPVMVPSAPCEIYFDIEGDPLWGVDYLFGVLIAGGDNDSYTAFVAEKPEDEARMWTDFVAWVLALPPDYVVFHYAPYEQTRLQMFTKKYAAQMSDDDRQAIAQFQARLFDLNNITKEYFVFPLYFYGLKQICKSLGFSWRNSKGSGAQSIFWYEEWLRSGDRAVLDEIIAYNEDDVRATKFLRDWIVNFKQS